MSCPRDPRKNVGTIAASTKGDTCLGRLVFGKKSTRDDVSTSGLVIDPLQPFETIGNGLPHLFVDEALPI